MPKFNIFQKRRTDSRWSPASAAATERGATTWSRLRRWTKTYASYRGPSTRIYRILLLIRPTTATKSRHLHLPCSLACKPFVHIFSHTAVIVPFLLNNCVTGHFNEWCTMIEYSLFMHAASRIVTIISAVNHSFSYRNLAVSLIVDSRIRPINRCSALVMPPPQYVEKKVNYLCIWYWVGQYYWLLLLIFQGSEMPQSQIIGYWNWLAITTRTIHSPWIKEKLTIYRRKKPYWNQQKVRINDEKEFLYATTYLLYRQHRQCSKVKMNFYSL